MMNNGFRSFTDHLLKGIQANENRMTEYVEKSMGIITAVNPHLGYETATEIAREATLAGKSVRELCL
jgi:aspartate ammonia-lyase